MSGEVAANVLELGLSGPKTHSYTLPDGSFTVVQGTIDSPGKVLYRKSRIEGVVSGTGVVLSIPGWVNKIKLHYYRLASSGPGICVRLIGASQTYRGMTQIYPNASAPTSIDWATTTPNPGIPLRGNSNDASSDFTGVMEFTRNVDNAWDVSLDNSVVISAVPQARNGGNGRLSLTGPAAQLQISTFTDAGTFQVSGNSYTLELEA